MNALVLLLVLTPVALALAWRRPAPRRPGRPTAEALEVLLPQLQCRQCGYPGCRPFAEALADGRAHPGACAPGGEPLARELSIATGVPFDHPTGRPAPEPLVARVVERDCIGCTRCLEVCPVDAIVGAAGMLHGVLAARCTGCALCPTVCPTDCIVMEPVR